MERTFYIEHLGCAKNRVDAQRMIDLLVRDGWVESETPEPAELIIVNSCGFIEPAKRESIDTTLAFRQSYPGKRIILAGCLSERYGNELFESMPEINTIFGNRRLERIVEIADSSTDERILAVDDDTSDPVISGPRDDVPVRAYTIAEGRAAYVKIAEGCRNRCSFCAIPLIRGPLASRPASAILSDVEMLLQRGVREINLIAQDIASYGIDLAGPASGAGETGDSTAFVDLVRTILQVPGDYWLRLLYIHPDHFPRQILPVVAADSRLLPYFDLPFQHASESILRRMGRRGNAESYLRLIHDIRSELPGAIIRSTFLVGFPGETSRDGDELLAFQDAAQIDWLGVFEYSREEGTAAYGFGKPSKRDQRRAHGLRNAIEEKQIDICESRLDRFVGTTMRVLIEEPMPDVELAIGRGYLNAPEVDGNVVVHGEGFREGDVYDCRIIKRNGVDLEAVVEETHA